MRTEELNSSVRNHNTLTHHQTFASKTYVMINTVILSSIFDYLYLLFYCELENSVKMRAQEWISRKKCKNRWYWRLANKNFCLNDSFLFSLTLFKYRKHN